MFSLSLHNKPEIKDVKIAIIDRYNLTEDVIERLDGNEAFIDYEWGNKIYRMSTIRKISENASSFDDDTNETTLVRIQDLAEHLQNVDFLFVMNN